MEREMEREMIMSHRSQAGVGSQAGGGCWPLGGPIREGAGGLLLSNHTDPGKPSKRPHRPLAYEESTWETKATWHPERSPPSLPAPRLLLSAGLSKTGFCPEA